MVLKNIEELCRKKGTNIHQLELKAGIGNGTIRRWDKSEPSLSSLFKVADALGVSVNSLIREIKKGKE